MNILYCFLKKGAENDFQKIKYLLEERGHFYYQSKVPKSLVYHLEIARWHNPVGEDYTQAIGLVEREREAVSIKLDAEYQAKVVSGEIDDAEILVDIEAESFLGREFLNWKILAIFLVNSKGHAPPD